jgi:hypothetical protein
LIAVISLLITGLVVTAVLVSVRMFLDNNLEVLKVGASFTLNEQFSLDATAKMTQYRSSTNSSELPIFRKRRV